jgi:hypothetical protein
MTSRLTFILEEVPSNGGRATSEFIFRDLDRRRWTSGDPIATVTRRPHSWGPAQYHFPQAMSISIENLD